jgi:hypothetical protein
MLHVVNGDATRMPFEQSGMPGDVTVYADALLEGPVPAGLTDAEMREVRERFWSNAASPQPKISSPEVSVLATWQRGMDAYPRYEEVVLWLEHDLFDQLLLIRHLDWFARHDLGATRLSLICIGRFPGIEMFKGLGQLTPGQLASLLDTRAVVTMEQLALGRRAWRAFTSPDPGDVERLIDSDTSALPFLGPALRRWLEEFPAIGSGLPRSEREILSLLEDGPQSIWSLFHGWSRREDALTPTDASLRSRMDALASGLRPLITVQIDAGDSSILPSGTVTRTDEGRDVLAGGVDWTSLAPFDRWLGGVHVTNGSLWRWDAAHARIHRRAIYR